MVSDTAKKRSGIIALIFIIVLSIAAPFVIQGVHTTAENIDYYSRNYFDVIMPDGECASNIFDYQKIYNTMQSKDYSEFTSPKIRTAIEKFPEKIQAKAFFDLKINLTTERYVYVLVSFDIEDNKTSGTITTTLYEDHLLSDTAIMQTSYPFYRIKNEETVDIYIQVDGKWHIYSHDGPGDIMKIDFRDVLSGLETCEFDSFPRLTRMGGHRLGIPDDHQLVDNLVVQSLTQREDPDDCIVIDKQSEEIAGISIDLRSIDNEKMNQNIAATLNDGFLSYICKNFDASLSFAVRIDAWAPVTVIVPDEIATQATKIDNINFMYEDILANLLSDGQDSTEDGDVE